MKLFHLRARRFSFLAVISIVVALGVAACGGGGSSDSSSSSSGPSSPASGSTVSAHDVSLDIGFVGTGGGGIFTGPEGFAYSKGLLQKWLAAEGVTQVKTAEFANGSLLDAALVGGSVNVGLTGDTPALIAASQGAPTRLINQSQVNLPSEIIANKSITSLSQLSGQTVGRQQASFMDRYLQGLLEENELTGKVSLGSMQFAQSIAAFNSGAIPAIVIIPTLEPLISAPFNVVAKSSETPQLQGTGLTVINNDLLSEDAGLPAAWNAARAKAIAYANANQSAYYAFEAKAQQSSPAMVKQYFPLSNNPTPPFTSVGLASLESTLEFLVETNQAKEFSISSWRAS
jgi:sulfonate transport system substrate-binding protein